jgi:hypothetical protein
MQEPVQRLTMCLFDRVCLCRNEDHHKQEHGHEHGLHDSKEHQSRTLGAKHTRFSFRSHFLPFLIME